MAYFNQHKQKLDNLFFYLAFKNLQIKLLFEIVKTLDLISSILQVDIQIKNQKGLQVELNIQDTVEAVIDERTVPI